MCKSACKFALPRCHRCHVVNHVHEAHECQMDMHMPGCVAGQYSFPLLRFRVSIALVITYSMSPSGHSTVRAHSTLGPVAAKTYDLRHRVRLQGWLAIQIAQAVQLSLWSPQDPSLARLQFALS